MKADFHATLDISHSKAAVRAIREEAARKLAALLDGQWDEGWGEWCRRIEFFAGGQVDCDSFRAYFADGMTPQEALSVTVEPL